MFSEGLFLRFEDYVVADIVLRAVDGATLDSEQPDEVVLTTDRLKISARRSGAGFQVAVKHRPMAALEAFALPAFFAVLLGWSGFGLLVGGWLAWEGAKELRKELRDTTGSIGTSSPGE